MKFDIRPYLNAAQRVLIDLDFAFAQVQNGLSGPIQPKTVVITKYENGREHGYCLRMAGLAVGQPNYCISFSESRNSDQIVVYIGWAFDRDTGCPTEAAYHTAQYFERDDASKAAVLISAKVNNHTAPRM